MGKQLYLKVKLGHLVDSEEALAELAHTRLPLSVKLKLNQVVREVMPHIRDFHELNNKALAEYGVPREDDPRIYDIKPEFQRQYSEERTNALRSDVTLNGIGKIRASMLGNVELESDIWLLRWLIKDDMPADTFFEGDQPDTEKAIDL